MSLKDTATGYGWISIALHWVTAIVIVYLLYIGSSIGSLEGEARNATILRHTSVAITTYLLLLARIVWRFHYGHPGPSEEQRGWAFTLGKWTHMAILVVLCLQLVTGPLMRWSYGNEIEVFDWFVIPSPFEPSLALAGFLHTLHRYAATFIFVAILLHIGGVYKHTAFNQDGTLAKIIFASRQSGNGAAQTAADSEGKGDDYD